MKLKSRLGTVSLFLLTAATIGTQIAYRETDPFNRRKIEVKEKDTSKK